MGLGPCNRCRGIASYNLPMSSHAASIPLDAVAAAAAPDFRRDPRGFLLSLYAVAVRRAQPLHTLKDHLPKPPKGRTVVIGAGKAGAAMAQAVEALWPDDAPMSGLVVTRYGHIPERPQGLKQRVEIAEAAHPVPDAAGMAAAERILQLVQVKELLMLLSLYQKTSIKLYQLLFWQVRHLLLIKH